MEKDKKAFVVEKTLDQFLKNGCKIITMDDIASEFGLSKKTLYTMFENKEALLIQAIDLLWDNFSKDVTVVLDSNENAIKKLILIHRLAIAVIDTIEPIFLLSLKKYHRKVMVKHISYRKLFANNVVLKLLNEAKQETYIESNVNLVLFYEVNLDDFDERIWRNNFLAKYSKEDALEYFITRKIRGILSKEYLYLVDEM